MFLGNKDILRSQYLMDWYDIIWKKKRIPNKPTDTHHKVQYSEHTFVRLLFLDAN